MDPRGISRGRFRRTDRLLDPRDFRRVLRSGRRLYGDSKGRVEGKGRASRDRADFVVVIAKGRENSVAPKGLRGVQGARVGITVSRKVGNAVVRNRFKRRVRDWFRRRQSEIAEQEGEVDLVVIARPTASRLNQSEIDSGLSLLLGLGGGRPPAEEGGNA